MYRLFISTLNKSQVKTKQQKNQQISIYQMEFPKLNSIRALVLFLFALISFYPKLQTMWLNTAIMLLQHPPRMEWCHCRQEYHERIPFPASVCHI